MPQQLKQYLDEREFLKMRQACNRSKSLEEFEAVVARYNDTFNLGGAVVAVQVRDRRRHPPCTRPHVSTGVTPLSPSHSLEALHLSLSPPLFPSVGGSRLDGGAGVHPIRTHWTDTRNGMDGLQAAAGQSPAHLCGASAYHTARISHGHGCCGAGKCARVGHCGVRLCTL